MQATFHVVVLLLFPLATVAICLRRGTLPPDWKLALKAAGRALLTLAVATIVLFILAPYCKCGPGNNPFAQKWVPLLSALFVSFFVGAAATRRLFVISAVVVAVLLSWHFNTLVLDRTSCLYTGDPAYIANSCRSPAEADPLWHTPITGLYAIKKL